MDQSLCFCLFWAKFIRAGGYDLVRFSVTGPCLFRTIVIKYISIMAKYMGFGEDFQYGSQPVSGAASA